MFDDTLRDNPFDGIFCDSCLDDGLLGGIFFGCGIFGGVSLMSSNSDDSSSPEVIKIASGDGEARWLRSDFAMETRGDCVWGRS